MRFFMLLASRLPEERELSSRSLHHPLGVRAYIPCSRRSSLRSFAIDALINSHDKGPSVMTRSMTSGRKNDLDRSNFLFFHPLNPGLASRFLFACIADSFLSLSLPRFWGFTLSKAAMPQFKQAPFCLGISKLTGRPMTLIGSFPTKCSRRIWVIGRLGRVTLAGHKLGIPLGLLGLGFGIFELGLEQVTLAGHKLGIPLGLLGLGFGIFELGLERVTLAGHKLGIP